MSVLRLREKFKIRSCDALKVRCAFIETSPPFAKENQRERNETNFESIKEAHLLWNCAEAPSSSASAFSRSSVGSSTIFSLVIQTCFDLIDDFTEERK